MGGRRNSTVDRAIEVLMLFTEQQPVLSASDIAIRLKMPRSTTYRFLQTLRSYNLLEDDRLSGGLRLGPRILELAKVAQHGLEVINLAQPVMNAIANQTG